MLILIANGENTLYELNKYMIEKLDNDIILYLEKEEKILTMNETASFIWNKLVEADAKEEAISDKDIVNEMINVYKCKPEQFLSILTDVSNSIELLINSNAIIVKNHDI